MDKTPARPRNLTCYVSDGAIFEASIDRVLANGVFVPCQRDDIPVTSSVRVDFHSEPPVVFNGQVSTWVKGRGVRIEASQETPSAVLAILEQWAASAEESAPQEPAKPPPVPIKKRVLVIDDDLNILRMLERRLTRLGYEIATTHSPRSGLSLADGRIDAVLLDWMLPVIPGADMLQKLRTEHAGVPIAVISGALWWDDAEAEILKMGASTVLEKPIDLERVVGWIEQVTEVEVEVEVEV